jgi:hypothetical protein
LRGQLLLNQVLDREGYTIKEAGSVLPEAVVARVYELSYEYMVSVRPTPSCIACYDPP